MSRILEILDHTNRVRLETSTDSDQEVARLNRGTPWFPTLFGPYMAGVSEQLQMIAARFGVRTWMSYGGKLQERVSKFKDNLHSSKCHHSVYSVACSCGCHYIGESSHNLKIRIHEHSLHSSKSAISLHVKSAGADHEIVGESTMVISQEKNLRKRKFMESVCIKAKAQRLCNTGGSVLVSDVWNVGLPAVTRDLSDLD